jgi:hypothetical protein
MIVMAALPCSFRRRTPQDDVGIGLDAGLLPSRGHVAAGLAAGATTRSSDL